MSGAPTTRTADAYPDDSKNTAEPASYTKRLNSYRKMECTSNMKFKKVIVDCWNVLTVIVAGAIFLPFILFFLIVTVIGEDEQ